MKLYFLKNTINGKCYVGFTKRQDISARIKEHFSSANCGSNNCPKLYKAIRHYGADKFVWQELYEGYDAHIKEEGFILLMGHYNVAPGGEGNGTTKGYKHTEQARKNMSMAHIGITHSEECRSKISKSNIGKHSQPKSKEARERMSLAKKGIVWHPNIVKIRTKSIVEAYKNKPSKEVSDRNRRAWETRRKNNAT